jgi:hypothetical protein
MGSGVPWKATARLKEAEVESRPEKGR